MNLARVIGACAVFAVSCTHTPPPGEPAPFPADFPHVPDYVDDDGGADTGSPAFSISAGPDLLRVPQGGGAQIYFSVVRARGFREPIRVTMDGLPEGVSVNTMTLDAEDSDGTLVVFGPKTVGVPLPNAARVRGYSESGTRSALVHLTVRGNPGSLDTSFGSEGFAGVGMGPLRDVVEIEGRKLLVTGSRSDNLATVACVNEDGSLDTSFGLGGWAHIGEEWGTAAQVAVTGAGVHVLGSMERRLFLARLTHSGRPDMTFGESGIVWLPLPSMTVGDLVPVDGGLVLTGNDLGRTFLARIADDGALDPAFGNGGVVTFESAYPSDLLRLPDGRFVIATGTRLFMFHADGAPDFAFGNEGSLAFDAHEHLASAISFDGEQLIAVAASMKVTHISLDGAVGATSAQINPPAESDDFYFTSAEEVEVHADGSIVIAGGVHGESFCMAMARLESDATRDAAFGEDGLALACRGSGTDTSELVRLRDGRYVLVGLVHPGDSIVARIWD